MKHHLNNFHLLKYHCTYISYIYSILFNKELKIEQAMYNLYNQIQIKGLYFFCTRVDKKDNKMKYVILKPG
jgi:hypothetical protein